MDVEIKVDYEKISGIGGLLMLISWVWGFIETAYFGFNMFPQSHAELMCDFFACTISGAGLCLVVISIILRLKY